MLMVLSFISNKLIETTIVMCLFYIFRARFEKQFHARSIFQCAIITSMVFSMVLVLELPLSLSLLFSVLFVFTLTMSSYYVRDYMDNLITIKDYEKRLNKFKKQKPLDNLSEDELFGLFPNIKYDTIHLVYLYLHRNREITANDFAIDNNISEQLIYKYLKQIKIAYKDLGK